MGNLRFLSLLFCVVVASVDFASCLKCYSCVYSEPYYPEAESVASESGLNYNKACGGETQNDADLETGPGPITPAQLPNTTTSFISKLVITTLTKVSFFKVLLGQVKTQKSSNINGTLTPSGSAKFAELCMTLWVKVDTAKMMEGSEDFEIPPGIEIPDEASALLRGFTAAEEALNDCISLKDLPPETQAGLMEYGIKEFQQCRCSTDGCNGRSGAGGGGDGGDNGGGGASTVSLGIFSTIFAIFMYATTF